MTTICYKLHEPPAYASDKPLRTRASKTCCSCTKIIHSSPPAQAYTAFLVRSICASSNLQPTRVIYKRPGTVVLPAACFSPDVAYVHMHARRAFFSK